MKELKTTIGLEIHVQLKTKSKMFCRCDNEAFQKEPNITVCPICLGMPGTLPVMNKDAILSTIKTGLVLGSEIPKIAKFDRKHYFYPDLPKGYQISQYDEPFCSGGSVELDGHKIRLNRIHLEEDAGKLIHSDGKSLVDLNRAGTPLMEIVTEPDITSPLEAGDFLRKLQKIVRDVVAVSEASMEKGHLRCDANISVTDGEKMSEIVELKNLNSFKFVEKALAIEEERLKKEYPDWKNGKVTRGYDNKKNETYAQRQKEEAADYRYFPEPDLPPVDTSEFDLDELKNDIGKSHEARLDEYLMMEIARADAGVLVTDAKKDMIFEQILSHSDPKNASALAKAIVHNYFNFEFNPEDEKKASEYAKTIEALNENKISKSQFGELTNAIHEKNIDFEQALELIGGGQVNDENLIEDIVERILENNKAEVSAYKAGKTQLLGFFMGLVMREAKGSANPQVISRILEEKLK